MSWPNTAWPNRVIFAMNMKFIETVFLGSMLFGTIGNLLIFYFTRPEMKRKKKPDSYADVTRKTAVYRQEIEKLAAENRVGSYTSRLDKIMHSFDDWEAYINQLIARLLEFENNEIVQHDRTTLPRKIQRIRYRLSREKNPRLRQEIQETLTSYLRHQERLDKLLFLMEKTELDLEEAVSGIGVIHSQLQTLRAMDIRSRRARRLAHGIAEERIELDDLLNALDEVYEGITYHL